MAELPNDIELKFAAHFIWGGVEIPVWFATYHNGQSFCPPVVFLDSMPETLQTIFMQWLDARHLSITMPPRLSKSGRAYFLDDVQSAIEGAGMGGD
ncbi:hypothetical protein [Aquitalea sp. ASV15]|uniref:hypothetical protein n=1 Tax=Aquitalea sp. ASV15 TaxID=2795104 RepID=UPI0018EC25ED|nr:hypothetical protein [Aquitalea sp. ASV15]